MGLEVETRNHNFYNLNSTRAYPLDDRATRTGDADERLPNDIIVDINLRFPSVAGQYAYLSSVAVTERLVTATFLACPSVDAPPDSFVPLAAVTVLKPLLPGRHYALDALYPGVGGWIVFGDSDETFKARFSTPQQGLLLPRCARPYPKLPIESIRKLGVGTGLTGIVALRGTGDIEVVADDRRIDGLMRKVVVVRLNSFNSTRNVFDLYKGPCGARPESENCDKKGVEFINTVGPDCNGNLQILFTGDTEVTPYDGSSEGLILDHPIGLTDACTRDDRLPDRNGRLPNEYDDNCTSEFEGQYDDDDDGVAEDLASFNVPNVSSEAVNCPDLPYLETFDDVEAESWRVLVGQFGLAVSDSPDEPLHGNPVSSGVSLSAIRSYEAQSPTRRNVSIWDTCATADTLNKRIRTDVKLGTGGVRTNGGIVLNYHTVGTTSLRDEYLIAEIDQPTDSLRLRFWNGAGFSTLAEVNGLGLVVGDWYRIEVEVTPGPDPLTQTYVAVTLTGVSDPLITATFTALTTEYLPANGRFGLGSDQALAQFSFFYLEDI